MRTMSAIPWFEFLSSAHGGADWDGKISAMACVLDTNGQKVVRALENAQYNWRTIDGIAQETGIDPHNVANILMFLPNAGIDVVQSSVPDKNGRALYTTRNHYVKSQSLANRLLSVFSDRIK